MGIRGLGARTGTMIVTRKVGRIVNGNGGNGSLDIDTDVHGSDADLGGTVGINIYGSEEG